MRYFYDFQLKHEKLVEKALKSGLITASKNCCKLSWLIRRHRRVVDVPFSVQRLIKFWPIIFVTRASRDSRHGPPWPLMRTVAKFIYCRRKIIKLFSSSMSLISHTFTQARSVLHILWACWLHSHENEHGISSWESPKPSLADIWCNCDEWR